MNRKNRESTIEAAVVYPVYEYIDKNGDTLSVDDLNDSIGLLSADAIDIKNRGEKEVKQRVVGTELGFGR